MENNISGKSKVEMGVNAILQLVPIAGPSISSVWTSYRQEKKNLRFEKFMREVLHDLGSLAECRKDLSGEEAEELGRLIELTLEKVESQSSDERLGLLRQFLESSISEPPLDEFDEKKVFLEELSSLSDMEIRVLVYLYQNPDPIQIKSLNLPSVDGYAALGGINKSKSRGFIAARRGAFVMNGMADEAFDEIIFLSDYGRSFVSYWLPR